MAWELMPICHANRTVEWPAASKVMSDKNKAGHQQEELCNYASQLGQLYTKNQTIMDHDAYFRSPLYSTICCLLIQDDQVLSSPSVTKLIEAIRAHLESTSRFYASVSNSLQGKTTSGSASPAIQPEQQQHQNQQLELLQDDKNIALERKSSLDSVSVKSSTSSTANTTLTPGISGYHSSNANDRMHPRYTPVTCGSAVRYYDNHRDISNADVHLRPEALALASRRQKPVDFRRISSVSYNDEQLINDLCHTKNSRPANRGNLSLIGDGQIESPWRYDELSSEWRFNVGSNCHTSQSSLENHSTGCENMTASEGLGESANQFFLKSTGSGRLDRKRHSDVSHVLLKPPQQSSSYLSTDDCLGGGFQQASGSYLSPTSLYERDTPTLHQQVSKLRDNQPVDVQSRRAELEWTLNKLINYELKYNWIVSDDTLRRAIRKIGVPNEIRDKVWLVLIDKAIGTNYDAANLLAKASKTIESDDVKQNQLASLSVDDDTQSILKQINLDVSRTMPGNKLFNDGAEGGIKLRRILVAYSIHVNRAIGFICIVDHIFPSKFYFDHYLTGARADQFLLADFICDQLIKSPTAVERKMVEGVTSSITLNWFISLFHGAVPTLTRLTILDHFMLEGVKALFRFTMAILYLAFQQTPPSSCEVFATIRNTARDMYDLKLLLSIVDQIKLPKDSYFAIRRSFYMVQSSFNSDQFYMQTLSNDAHKQLVPGKPLSLQQLPNTKPPAMSLLYSSSSHSSAILHNSSSAPPSPSTAAASAGNTTTDKNFTNQGAWNKNQTSSRICVSSNKSKICIQNIGKLGRSHIKVTDAQYKSNERSLISPLRNCLVIGISDCGKIIVVARQSSRRNFRVFREQDLVFHVYEMNVEIHEGFYLESTRMVLLITASGELLKLRALNNKRDFNADNIESLTLRDCGSIEEEEKLKIRLSSMDPMTNLLWCYVECEDASKKSAAGCANSKLRGKPIRPNSPCFGSQLSAMNEDISTKTIEQTRSSPRRRFIIVDVLSFDIFSAFELQPNFGEIISMKTTLLAFCLLANPMSNQFSSRMVRVGPTGRSEHLFSFSDVVDYSIHIPNHWNPGKSETTNGNSSTRQHSNHQKYSATLNKLLTQFMTVKLNGEKKLDVDLCGAPVSSSALSTGDGKLTNYYRSLMRRHSVATDDLSTLSELKDTSSNFKNTGLPSILVQPATPTNSEPSETNSRAPDPIGSISKILRAFGSDSSYSIGEADDKDVFDYIPINMTFIFRNGKIAMFEFTESYAVHTRESQLDRYDYSKVIDVTKDGQDFILTILTIFERLLKVVI